MRVVILGIGNLLLSDESVGVRALEALRDGYDVPPEVTLIDGGTSGMELLEDLEDVDLLIVLDAVFAKRAPGSFIRLSGDEVPVFFRRMLSPHQVGLSEVLASLDLLGRAPREVVVLGVQPLTFATGMDLSAPVAARLPELVEAAVRELEAHGIRLEPRAMPLARLA
jgi:hydrogenase maturation protease